MEYDVVIVGAGPSGSTCAKYLAEHGINVLLVDKYPFPRHKTCAGGLLQHTFREFPYIEPLIEQYNTRVSVHDADLLSSFSIESDVPLVAMTSGRKHFDNGLVELAKKAGAQFRDNFLVKSVKYIKDGIEVQGSDDVTLTAKLVVGADSIPGIVGKSLSFGLPPASTAVNTFGIAYEKEFQLGKEVCEKYFGKERCVSLFLHYGDLAGYGWIFPRQESVNIGIGGADKDSKKSAEMFQVFLDQLIEKQIIPEKDIHGNKINADKKIGAILPATVPNTSIITDRALLVGDAGGFCSPATGEGIYYAMKSGQEAGKTIVELMKKGNGNPKFSKKQLMNYYKRIKSTLVKELRFQKFAMEKVLRDPRRSRKAVSWGQQDAKLRDLFGKFLVGARSFDNLQYIMLYHYTRCKIKEKLGIIKRPSNVTH